MNGSGIRARIIEERKPVEAQYTGWSRFFLCTAHGGHNHSTTSCSTTYIGTEFVWLPGLLNAIYYGNEKTEVIDRIAQAIAAKTDESVNTIKAEHKAKAEKKYRKERGSW